MITSCGSEKISVKIVDSFCDGKYYPQKELNKQDFDNINEIRSSNPKYKVTIDKYNRHLTINEKEYKQCQ